MSHISWDEDLEMPKDGLHVEVFHEDAEAKGRTPFESLQVGQELDGVVVVQHLYHGAIVDVGAEADGFVHSLPRLHAFLHLLPLTRLAASSTSASLTGSMCATYSTWALLFACACGRSSPRIASAGRSCSTASRPTCPSCLRCRPQHIRP